MSGKVHTRTVLYFLAVIAFLLCACFLLGCHHKNKKEANRGTPEADIEPFEKAGNDQEDRLLPKTVRGTVLDVTGHLAAILEEVHRTIWVAYVTGGVPPELTPGKTVTASGRFQKGLIYTNAISVTGGVAWPTPSTQPQPSG